MNVCCIGNYRRRHHMRDGVECSEALMDRHFENRGRGIDGTIDGTHALAVPPPADTISAFTVVPCRPEAALIETPDEELRATERRR